MSQTKISYRAIELATESPNNTLKSYSKSLPDSAFRVPTIAELPECSEVVAMVAKGLGLFWFDQKYIGTRIVAGDVIVQYIGPDGSEYRTTVDRTRRADPAAYFEAGQELAGMVAHVQAQIAAREISKPSPSPYGSLEANGWKSAEPQATVEQTSSDVSAVTVGSETLKNTDEVCKVPFHQPQEREAASTKDSVELYSVDWARRVAFHLGVSDIVLAKGDRVPSGATFSGEPLQLTEIHFNDDGSRDWHIVSPAPGTYNWMMVMLRSMPDGRLIARSPFCGASFTLLRGDLMYDSIVADDIWKQTTGWTVELAPQISPDGPVPVARGKVGIAATTMASTSDVF